MSFGSSGFGGFGTNNQQQQPAQQPSTGFGGFGATNTNALTGGFGTTGNTGFGGTNNTTGGGLFGGGGNTANTGFGSSTGFGTNNQQTSGFGSRPAFGSTTANTGGSLFGGGQASTGSSFGGFGSTQQQTQPSTGFGSSPSGGGLFGPTNQPSGFGNTTGGGSSLFGGTTAFGSSAGSNTGFGQPATTGFGASASSTQNQGTGGTPFTEHTEKDNTQTSKFQSITCLPQYVNFSFEELRVVDYNQGRKYGNQNGQAGAFGTSTGFGGIGQTNANTGFGGLAGSSSFGSQPATNTTGFGSTQQSSGTAFGSTAGGGLFGQNKPASTGLFGSTPSTSGQQGGGLFGTSNTTGGFGSTTGGFGSTSTGTGLFGQPQQPAKPLFGQTPSTGGTGFGSTSTGGFGQQTGATGGGLFGSTNNQPAGFGAQPQNMSSPFGGFGANNQTQTQPNQTQSGGLFGSGFGTSNQSKPLFGSSNTTTGSGLFGQTQPQQQQTQQPGGLFGTNSTNQTGSSLFAPKPATGGGLFGGTQNNNTSSGLFGNPNSQNQQSQSLFGGNQPKPGGIFGSGNTNNSGGTNLFGGSIGQPINQQSGNTSLFGNPPNQQSQSSLFGGSLQNQQQLQQSQQLTTSIMSNNPYGNDHLFANLGTPPQAVGPLATPLSSSQKARRPAPLLTYKLNPAASSRLITPQKRSGYGFDYSSYGTPGSAVSNASPSLYGARLGGSLGRSMSASNIRSSLGGQESILNLNAFSAGGLRGSGSTSLKRLHINRNIRNDLFGVDGPSDSNRPSPLKKSVSFGAEAVESNGQSITNGEQANGGSSRALIRVEVDDSATPSAEEQGLIRSSASSRSAPRLNGSSIATDTEQSKGKELAVVPEDRSSSPPIPPKPSVSAAENARLSQKDQEPGEYYMIPSKAELEKMSRKQLSSIKPFIVGRKATATIEFLDVDLTNIDLDKICGGIVKLETRSATVYVDHVNKPPPGKGLNVAAIVTLDNSWPRSKGGRLPVYERKGPKFDKHIQRLQRVEETEFIEYRVETGQWVFRVDHFSTYRLEYADEENETSSSMLSAPLDSPTAMSVPASQRSRMSQITQEESSLLSNGSSAQISNVDDTFEFRRSRGLPGAFDDETMMDDDTEMNNAYGNHDAVSMDDYRSDDEGVETDTRAQQAPFYEDVSTHESIQGLDGTSDNTTKTPSPNMDVSAMPKSILKASQQQRTTFGTPSKTRPTLGADWATQLQQTISPKKQDRQALRESQGMYSTSAREKQSIKPATSTFGRDAVPFATSIDVMNSLFGTDKGRSVKGGKNQASNGKGFQWPYAKRSKPDDNANMAEQDRIFHNTFKPSWASDGTLVYAAVADATTAEDSMLVRVNAPVVSEGKDVQFARFSVAPDTVASPAMKKQRQLSIVVLDDGVPRARANEDLNFGDFVASVEDVGLAARHENLMWKLAAVLFDDPELDHIHRKDIFQQFWKQTVEQASLEHSENASSPEEKAIAHLSANNIWTATETLMAGRDYRLATMVAQIGSCESMRQDLEDQIASWRNMDVISEISPAVRALYELLAGNTCISDGKGGAGRENKAESFNISSRFGLDWKRAFGLKLWYGVALEDPLEAAIYEYWEDLRSAKEGVKPVPWFVDHQVRTGWNDERRQDRQDILWGLLMIYAASQESESDEPSIGSLIDLADIISPQNLAGNPVDARLSFQLYQALTARHVIDFDEEDRAHKADLLATDYAFQLAGCSGNLCDAIFVTLHLTDPEARRTAVVALLNRHAAAIGDSREACEVFQTLTDELKLPESWLWTAKALHAKAVLRDEVAEVRCLLRAGAVEQAHDTLQKSVAPRAVIEEDLDGLGAVLEAFEDAGAASLRGWDQGGGVYVDFVRFCRSDDAERAALAGKVAAALPRMGEAGLGSEERVAISEMGLAVGRREVGSVRLRETVAMSSAYYASVFVR